MRQGNISVIIPTYKREQVLLDTIEHLLRLAIRPPEIILIDQTTSHDHATSNLLAKLTEQGNIRWIRLANPSIPHAMNVGLKEAINEIVLFLDDDIIPDKKLIEAHLHAHQEGHTIVAGQVLQPGEEPSSDEFPGLFMFRCNERMHIRELMAGNFSIRRNLALSLGGFDENFIHVAYRFETEFAERALAAGESIFFEPAASIRHLKARSGGTRSYGEHLRTIKPSHCVGEYYYLMRSKGVGRRLLRMAARPLRAVRTKHHLRNPWWIPLTLASELLGFLWAGILFLRGPRYISVRGSEMKCSGSGR
jgi:GT2 family glycosyltransferase